MHSIGRRILTLLLLCSAALAASGIEVLSHKEVADGIEVLCVAPEGMTLEARAFVDADWVVVDRSTVQAGMAAVVFPELAPREACLVLTDASGEVVDRLIYVGQGGWARP